MWRKAVSAIDGQRLPSELVAMGGLILVVVFAGHLFGTFGNLNRWLERIPPAAMGFGIAGAFLLIMVLMPQDSTPFVYFQF